jgi:VIT1/CCC1 family predicted Fe2+/Mn2+ transporter
MVTEKRKKERGTGVLDPLERMSEVLFGVVMVLSFTCSLSAATAGREQVRTMLVAALGCSLAWGIVDAVMYVMGRVVGRAHTLQLTRDIRATADAPGVRAILEPEMPPEFAPALDDRAYDRIRAHAASVDLPPAPRLTRDDLRAAVAVFLLVFASTLPVVIPFVFVHDTHRAMRWSNGVAIVFLYLLGHRLAPYAGLKPWLLGLAMVGMGGAMVAICVALGG